MNALDRIFVNAGKSRMAARFLGVASAAALTSACVGDPIASAKVDPNSPIAAEVAKVSGSNRDYPSFNEIPPKPSDLRPAAMYGAQAHKLEMARDDLDRATAPGTWTLGGTTAFAERARTEAGPSPAAPGPGDT